MAIKSLAAVDGQCFQQANPGGGRNVFVVLVKDVVGNYPLSTHFNTDGTKIMALPTLVATKKWSQYLFPDGTLDYKVDDSGDPGYQSFKHMIELALAGKSLSLRTEMAKFINAGMMFLVEDKDGEYMLVGSTDDPVFLKKSFTLGKKGNDKRGYTLKGEVDGLTYGVVTLDSALLATFSPNLVPLPA